MQRNPRHLRLAIEFKTCKPSDPTTYRPNGFGGSGPYPEFLDSHRDPNHSGKYFGALWGGTGAAGACRTNWYANASFPRDRGYYSASWSTSGSHINTYAYVYSRSTQCGMQNPSNPTIQLTDPTIDGFWNRWEYEIRLQDPSLANSSWASGVPQGGDGFIKMFLTKDVDGTPSQRINFNTASNLVFFTSNNNYHRDASLGGWFMNHFHGGTATPNISYQCWIRRIEVYHYAEDDI